MSARPGDDHPPRRIMIAADGTEADHAAATRAVAIFGSEAHYTIVSVGSLQPFAAGAGLGTGTAMLLMADSADELDPKTVPRRAVADVASELGVGLDRIETVSEVGAPGPTIVRLAEERAIDVIVLGSHDRGWLSRLIEPSIGHYVVDHAPCDVLVVRSASES